MLRLFVMYAYIAWASIAYGHPIPSSSTFKPHNSLCDLELSYSYYDLCYSLFHRQALWTKHELTPTQVKGKQKRTNNFRSDERLTHPVLPGDYRHSGFDRGHLVPAADMKLNYTSMSETFYMTNMSPQDSSFNSGIWNALEAHIRNEVLKLGPAIIITAPILLEGAKYPKIKTLISVPSHFYKIAYYYQQPLMKAYLIPNAPTNGQKYQDFKVTVKDIETLTGYDFFSELEDSLENALESQI